MKTNYVLIDFENVQPKKLSILKGNDFRVIVFVGASQTKVPFELAEALQAFGDKAEYIKISGNGPNALDFHIAFYIGQLAEKDPNACFHVISKDTGFDPLIKHLKTKKIFVQREKELTGVPLLRESNKMSSEDKVSLIVTKLIGLGQSRPRKVNTLSNAINALFPKTLEEKELKNIIGRLKNKKFITIKNENITYTLPAK